MKNVINQDFLKIWQPITQGKKSDNALQFELDIHKVLFNMFQVGDWYYMVFNLPESKFDVVSPQVETVLGHKIEDFDLTYLLNHIHPEDLPHFLNFETFLIKFFEKFSIEQIMKYKMRYDYRVRKADGTYIRVLQQTVVIEHDEQGAVFRTLTVHTDISDLKTDNRMILSLIGYDGEPSYIDMSGVEAIHKPSNFLTKRERDIILLMIDGKLTKEIADTLGISKLTVDKYRKLLLQKTETSTAVELIAKAIRMGWV